MLELISSHPDVFAIVSVVIYGVENILPHTPLKSNSTVQLVVNIAKTLIGALVKKKK